VTSNNYVVDHQIGLPTTAGTDNSKWRVRMIGTLIG